MIPNWGKAKISRQTLSITSIAQKFSSEFVQNVVVVLSVSHHKTELFVPFEQPFEWSRCVLSNDNIQQVAAAYKRHRGQRREKKNPQAFFCTSEEKKQ